MVSAPPLPTVGKVAAEAAQLAVLWGDDDGTMPTRVHEVEWLIPARIQRTLGGDRLDSSTFDADLSQLGIRIVDTQVPASDKRLVCVYLVDPTDGSFKAISYGKVSERTDYIDAGREAMVVNCRVEPEMIGASKTSGIYVRHTDGTKQFVNQPIIFNPESDGEIVGNMSATAVAGVSWWLDPNSHQTAAGATVHGTAWATKWKLSDAVFALCQMLNESETYITNPTLDELQDVLSDADDNDVVREIEIDSDLWLSEALDLLLEPYGFSWFVELMDEVGTQPKLTVIPKGEGTEQQIFMQRPEAGTQITRDGTNVSDYLGNTSIADLVNQVKGFTSRVRRESTHELYASWPESDDTETLEAVNGVDKENDSIKFRQFVLNESGDWNGLRTMIAGQTDLQTLLADPNDGARLVPSKRRRFLPCLSLGTDGQPVGQDGYFLEFREEAGGSVWVEKDWAFDVLPDQCGIRLTDAVPSELHYRIQNTPNETPIRLTATIESDLAVEDTAARQTESPNGEPIEVVLDLSSKYHFREVDSGSTLYSGRHSALASNTTNQVVSGIDMEDEVEPGEWVYLWDAGENTGRYQVFAVSGATITIQGGDLLTADVAGTLAWRTTEADDTENLTEHLEQLRDADDHADVSCSITLDGIDHPEYELGTMLTGADGRNLSFDAHAAGTTPRYLQIVGFTMELDGQQKIELNTESFRAQRYALNRER